ncbi:hypothetical protein THC_0353 [Caldimicrobium thiodismutans]|uniref:Flagellar biosynthetic protein FliR n=1 Tax=Caldimicrobium thiodismutans TaxID=1653476 RepID=A0A0U5AWI6_9BACT|nr:flagellar biosynthetic protein FliR [Caldimicrobium thiodismutans]BAU22751.1 hypothetical protein THC_0353 [Caldimicrobium thiodismutans]
MTLTLIELLQREFFTFLLIFIRILLLWFLFPVFSTTFFPTKLRIALSMVLALAFTPLLSFKITPPQNFYEFLPYFLSDFLLIFVLSLFFRVILGGLQLGGELVGLQMGFGISQTFDPLGGVSMPIISQFIYLLLLLFFFTFDIHHHLIYFLIKSFYEIPPGSFYIKGDFVQFLLKKSGLIFDIAVRVLAPLLVFMLLINIILAIIGRLIPQINVLFVSFPLTLGLGLFFFGLMLFLIPKILNLYFNEFGKFMQIILKM